METLKAALNLVTPNCYFASIDLKDAYYSVPVSTGSQGWLSFYCFHVTPKWIVDSSKGLYKNYETSVFLITKIGT